MNFKDYLFRFINEPSKLGELVRAIYYGQSQLLIGQFQEQIQKIIDEDSNFNSGEDITKFNYKLHQYMTSEDRLKNIIPDLLLQQNTFTQLLERVYSSYELIKPITELGTNDDIFAIQYTSKDIPITERDLTMTKIISLPVDHICVNCKTNIHTQVFKQMISIDFLNNKIKYDSYFQCNKCNNITIDTK